jgi:hypothetical protein
MQNVHVSVFRVCCRWLSVCVDGSRAGTCHFLFTWQLQFVIVPLTQDVPFRNLQLHRGLKKYRPWLKWWGIHTAPHLGLPYASETRCQ